MFIGEYHVSNLITYLGMAAAVAGIGFSVAGRPAAGMLCLIVCGVCDLFDGVFARRFTRTARQKEFGVQIDSLADVLSFAALPVAVLASAGFAAPYHWALLALYVFAALTRLGYFNLAALGDASGQPIAHYRGLPVTYAAFFLPLLWLLYYTPLGGGVVWVYTAAVPALALLFVLDIPVAKPRGAAYVVFSILAVATAAVIIGMG